MAIDGHDTIPGMKTGPAPAAVRSRQDEMKKAVARGLPDIDAGIRYRQSLIVDGRLPVELKPKTQQPQIWGKVEGSAA